MILLTAIKKQLSPRNPLRLGWHFGKALLAAALYGFPARKLTVIGITGTDGKTTTVSMTAHILAATGTRAGALSTAFLRIDENIEWNETQKTSPSPFVIQQFLKRLVRAGCTHAVLEISSHGLVQGRVRHTNLSIAAVTNTSMEHLDYHGSLEQYRKDKGILFRMLKGRGTKVLNRDDESFPLYAGIDSGRTIIYAREHAAALSLKHESVSPMGTQATVQWQDVSAPLSLTIPGAFNLENALCAIGCALAAGIPLAACTEALRNFQGAPGRMEKIDAGQPFSVYVDFTVTPAAYEKTLAAVRDMLEPGKRILVLTGSCGDRMREKRPIVGRICSERADVVVVSNEDPYSEDPQKIIDEVFAGIDQAQCEAYRIFDRREAMSFLFRKAQPGDAVLLCAKGSDTTMWTAQGQIPWNEREIARELLQTR